MPPTLTARTVKDDPGYMLLYFCLKNTNAKPDFKDVATQMGLSSAEAASRRLTRLLKVQDAAETAATTSAPATTSTPATTSVPATIMNPGGVSAAAGSTVSKNAVKSKKPGTSKKSVGRKRSVRDEANGSDEENKVERAPKKRKMVRKIAVKATEQDGSDGDTIPEETDSE